MFLMRTLLDVFDNIGHQVLMEKFNASARVRKTIRLWLKAGVVDKNTLYSTEAGTPQREVISPLLANIALHGMDTEVTDRIIPILQQWYKEKHGRLRNLNALQCLRIIRYADDFVIIHESEEIIAKAKQLVKE